MTDDFEKRLLGSVANSTTKTFAEACREYLVVNDAVAIRDAWRKRHPDIKAFWDSIAGEGATTPERKGADSVEWNADTTAEQFAKEVDLAWDAVTKEGAEGLWDMPEGVSKTVDYAGIEARALAYAMSNRHPDVRYDCQACGTMHRRGGEPDQMPEVISCPFCKHENWAVRAGAEYRTARYNKDRPLALVFSGKESDHDAQSLYLGSAAHWMIASIAQETQPSLRPELWGTPDVDLNAIKSQILFDRATDRLAAFGKTLGELDTWRDATHSMDNFNRQLEIYCMSDVDLERSMRKMHIVSTPDYAPRQGKYRGGRRKRYAAGTYKGSRWAKRASRRRGNPCAAAYRTRPPKPLPAPYSAIYKGSDPALIDKRGHLVKPYRSRNYVRVQVGPTDHRWSHGWHKDKASNWAPRFASKKDWNYG